MCLLRLWYATYIKCVFENCILYLEKKQPVLPAPAEQIEFEPYKKYDINVGVGSYGFYWSSVPYSTYSGCCFRFYVGFFNYYVDPRAYGSAVRPVAEN